METLIRCRTWLNPLQNADAELKNNLKDKTEGTCTWILGMKEFNSIIEDKQRQHLWIHGQPGKSPAHNSEVILLTFLSTTGAGKSVLSSSMVQAMRDYSSIKHRVLHFFCKDGSPATSTAAAIIANLIDQLVKLTLKSLFTILKTARQNNATSIHCTDFATLWAIFLDMVRQFPTRIIVFVDALDECTVQRSDFLNALTSLPAEVDVRFCVTSRNYPDIKKAFAERLDIRTAEMTPEDDITRYLEDSVDKHEELHSHREEILEKVPRRGAGMFRYAVLIIDELLSSCVNISKTLESPPATLNECTNAFCSD